jgi:hypothetical protein
MPDHQTGRQLPALSRAEPRDLPASSRTGSNAGFGSKGHISLAERGKIDWRRQRHRQPKMVISLCGCSFRVRFG